MFDSIDTNKAGYISKLQLVLAMQTKPEVDEFIMPGGDSSGLMSDEWSFDAVDTLFEAISGGQKRINYKDFERFFSTGSRADHVGMRPRTNTERSENRLLIIGPGFGQIMNP